MTKNDELRAEVARLEREFALYESLARLKREQADRTDEIAAELAERLVAARSLLGSRAEDPQALQAPQAPQDQHTFRASEPLGIGLRDD